MLTVRRRLLTKKNKNVTVNEKKKSERKTKDADEKTTYKSGQHTAWLSAPLKKLEIHYCQSSY